MLLNFLLLLSIGTAHAQRTVEVVDNQLSIDGVKQPQLFGAEVQYFRLRGGYGKNIPRAQVIALWEKALDHFVEAKMNAISFYIPWDFHEYAEGKFDFTGTVDEDGDGNADYPSRDVVTFIKMIEQRGITRIMARPGPYINAEWGHMGFGAIPPWFHDKYPDSHMMTSWGWRTKLIDYLNADLLRHTQLWFEAVYNQVLKSYIGVGKPIVFLQLDNETNYQWQSIYMQDYSPASQVRYQLFLQNSYKDLAALNAAHQSFWTDWKLVEPPKTAGINITEDQDWYRFADYSMFVYLKEIRKIWQSIGVKEPEVLFTLAESFNATQNGILPNYLYRNSRGETGLLTVNLYPKTYETVDKVLMNLPFKADLDVKTADEAGDKYFGSKQQWVMGPEIQAGWWKGTDVSAEARKQTYLTVIGHGMKAMFVYYFNEGQNWQVEWAEQQVRPLFNELRKEWTVEDLPFAELSNEFWGELQARSDRTIILGIDVRRLMQIDIKDEELLYFDAPLDAEANPRPHFTQLKEIGEKIIAPYQDFLARSLEVEDEVTFVKDVSSHVPSPIAALNGVWVASDWSGGLLGYLLNADLNPKILLGDFSSESDFLQSKVLIHLDTANSSPRTIEMLKKAFNQGRTVVSFLYNNIARELGYATPQAAILPIDGSMKKQPLQYFIGDDGGLRTGSELDAKAVEIYFSGPIYTYELDNNCEPILYYLDKPAGYRCSDPKGNFIQIGALLFADYNSNDYSHMTDPKERRAFLKALLKDSQIEPQLQLSENAERIAAFARKDPEKKLLWITVKTGSRFKQNVKLQLTEKILAELPTSQENLQITDVFSGQVQYLTRTQVMEQGFDIELESDGSTVFVVQPANSLIAKSLFDL